MRRALLLSAFAVLLWQGLAWTRSNPVPQDERTFEASRAGFQPIATAGPLTRSDFVRLLLRREGDFRLPLTVNYRVWRRADPPDLWALDLPGVVKVDVSDGRVQVESSGGAEPGILGVGRVFNQPLMVRNQTDKPIDLQVSARIGGSLVADRFRLGPGLNFYSLNLEPKIAGPSTLSVSFKAGEESTPPDRLPQASFSRIVEVVEWGVLRLRTTEGGGPVHARVTVFGSDGLAYGPSQGTLSKITWTAGQPFFYSKGAHEIELPVGTATIRAVRGFEYVPAETTVEIRPGVADEVEIDLKRFSNLAEEGWYGGDDHIHANYNDHEFITPEDVLTQTLGEDLNVANLMTANSTGAQIHDAAYFEGRPHQLSQDDHVLRWIEEMRNAGSYGHMCLLGISRLIHPLYTGFQGTPHPYDYPANYHQAKAAQEAGGVASYAHPGYNFTDDPNTMSARELPVDLALGVIEAMDVLSNSNEGASVPYWYKLLNTGLRCSISGGSDSFTNRRHHWLPGGQRVYVHTGGALDYRDWIEAYRAGRSFATNGPLLNFTVNGELPGSEFELERGDTLEVKAAVVSLVSLDALEIVVNGEVVASSEGPGKDLEIEEEIVLEEGAWIAARARGPFDPLLVNDDNAFAHSSPVYCRVGGRSVQRPEDARFFVGWIDKLIERAEASERFADEGQRRETVALFREAQEFYRETAELRP